MALNDIIKPTTFFIGNQVHDSDLAPQIMATGKKLAGTVVINRFGSISTKFRNKFVVTSSTADFHNIGAEDIIEVMNYDPVRNSILAIGTKDPSPDTPLHWFIYRAFPTARAAIHIHDELVLNNFRALKLPVTSRKLEIFNAQTSLDVLSELKKNNYIIIKEHGSVVIGRNLNDVVELAIELNRKLHAKLENPQKTAKPKRK